MSMTTTALRHICTRLHSSGQGCALRLVAMQITQRSRCHLPPGLAGAALKLAAQTVLPWLTR